MILVHLSDLHFGAADPAVLEAARTAILRAEPEGIVVTGDLTQSGRRREFDAARDWLTSFDLPFAVTPGNHDTPMFQVHHRVSRPFARYRKRFSDFSFPMVVRNVRLDGLNTARGWQVRRNWAEGSVDLDDLDEIIALNSPCQTRVLACHHPFVSPTQSPLRTATRRGRRASERLAASRIQVLLSGHVHAPQAECIRTQSGSYLSVTSGTLSMRLRGLAPSFNLIEFKRQNVSIMPLSYQGGVFHHGEQSAWDLRQLERLAPNRVESSS